LYRIKTFDEIRKAGGSLKDVAVKWGMSPNSCGKVHYTVWNYKDELGIN